MASVSPETPSSPGLPTPVRLLATTPTGLVVDLFELDRRERANRSASAVNGRGSTAPMPYAWPGYSPLMANQGNGTSAPASHGQAQQRHGGPATSVVVSGSWAKAPGASSSSAPVKLRSRLNPEAPVFVPGTREWPTPCPNGASVNCG